MHTCQRASARPRAVRKERTPELLSCLPLTGPCHLLPLQTFVNDVRIPDQKYVTLKLHDVIRFGYDILSGPCPLLLAQVALGCPGCVPESNGDMWVDICVIFYMGFSKALEEVKT